MTLLVLRAGSFVPTYPCLIFWAQMVSCRREGIMEGGQEVDLGAALGVDAAEAGGQP